jgi:hypothetical protein
MNPDIAYKFAEIIESLTDPANVRPLVDEVYADLPRGRTLSDAEKADMTQRLVESFKELDAIVKGTDTTGQKAYFLDDPPTAIFVTAYNKAGFTNGALGDRCNACDDGRLWIHAAELGEDARKAQPSQGQKRAQGRS